LGCNRSLTFTITDLPFPILVTFIFVPNGNLLQAAVNFF
jgi:hypothetical protein